MKILMPTYPWAGGTQDFCVRAFEKLGHDVQEVRVPNQDQFRRKRLIWKRLLYFSPIDKLIRQALWKQFNRAVKEAATSFRPDMFFVINETCLWPQTLKFIAEKARCPLICWVADDPFDSVRFKCFPVNLSYFTHIFVGEPLWIPHIKMVASPETIECMHGGVDVEIFRTISASKQQVAMFSSSLSFVGSGYHATPEGLYRACILDSVVEYGLNIWGAGWTKHFKYLPTLRKAYQGRPTTLEETNIVNQVSDIVLNITHPQAFTAMQQRTFEIAASGGFQLADRRTEIDKLFPNGEIVQFTSREDLREKVRYYLDHPVERQELSQRAREVVLGGHTFAHRMQTMLEFVR